MVVVIGFGIGYIAGVVGLVALTVFVFCVPADKWWLLLAIPVRVGVGLILLLALFLLPLVMDTQVTPILVGGCPSGYIAIEPSGGGGSFVGVRDGVHIVSVQEYSADDFGRPFARGTYATHARGDEIDVMYDGGPGFTLPALAAAPSCR